MKKEEVIKWLKIMKANLNTFPEVSSGNKIEALAEAIRVLKNEQSEKPTGSTTKNDLGVDCISRVEALNCLKATELKKFDWIIDARKKISKLPSVTPQEPRWIPDSEGLPENNEYYLVTHCYQNEKETIEAVYKEDEDEAKWFDVTGVEITLAVTAWMPKPKPYSEVEE